MDRNFFIKALSLVQERTKKLSEVSEFLRFFFVPDNNLVINPVLYTHVKMGTSQHTAKEALLFSQAILTSVPEKDWDIESLKKIFMEHITQNHYKNGFILYPLRVALSGEEFSPGTFELIEIFGKSKTLTRLAHAIDQL